MEPIPKSVKAVIFDLDDTLVASTVDYAKFKMLVIDRIVSRGEDRSAYSPNETVVSIISRYEQHLEDEGLKGEELKSRLAELDAIMDAVELEHVAGTKAIPGAMRLLRLLKSNGIKVGILTRGCGQYARSALDTAGLAGLVDEIECRNQHSKPKPDPEAYLRLAARLGVDKSDTLFVGDHPIDAQCARNAEVGFIAVETGDVPKDRLQAAGCIDVFPDVGHLVDWFEKTLHVEGK